MWGGSGKWWWIEALRKNPLFWLAVGVVVGIVLFEVFA